MDDEAVVDARHGRSALKVRFHTLWSRYLSLLRRRWWVLVLGVLAGAAIQCVMNRFEAPAFASVGRMIVSVKLNIAEGSLYNEELNNSLGTQVALMQSDVVTSHAHARVMARQLGLKVKPVALKVTVLPKTMIFLLQATGGDPEYTQAFLQACMEEYIALKKEMRTQTADNTVAGLTAEVKRLEKDLRQADEEIGAFQRTNSVMMSQDQDNSTSVCLAALKQRLTAQRSEYELLQMLTPDQSLDRQQETGWALPQAGDAASKPWAAVSERTDADYFKVKQQLLLLQAEHEEMGHYLRTKHPKMVAMSEEIARQERLLKVFRMQSVEQLEVKKVSLKLEIHNLEREVKQWEVQMVENQHKTLEDQWKIAEYQKLKSNAQRTQAFYDRLLATMQTLDVNKEISPESVVIMEPASRAFREQSAVWIKKASGAFIGLVLVVALLLLFDLLDDRMTSLAELKAAFDEDVVGHIPREKSRGPEREVALIQPGDKRPRFVKAYRNLRSSLLCMAGTEAWPKTLLVTSSVPNEGKSLTSANLALTMANAGSRVLLVDADMCKGALHERFHLPSKPGLSQVLTQRVHWEEAVQPTQFPNLFLLPQGGPLPKGCDLFLNEAAERFLRDVAAKYDFVILDTVPVMAEEGDVTRLAPHVEGVLFVIRAEFTSACVAHAALDILYQSKVRVLGLLFNSARSRFEDYYYYRQRDYYTKYPAEAASPKAETQQIGKG